MPKKIILFLGFLSLIVSCALQGMEKEPTKFDGRFSDFALFKAKVELKIKSYSLHVASRDGNIEKAKLLIQAGADVNAKNENRSPLFAAAFNGQAEIIDLLLACGADVNRDYKNNLIYCAVKKGNAKFVELLIKNGTSVNVVDEKDHSLLYIASGKGDASIVKLLIASGAEVNAQGGRGWTALHHACFHGHTNVVKLLLDNNAKVNTKTISEDTPLHKGAYRDHAEIIQLLFSQFTLPKAKLSTKFINKEYKQEIWNLKRLALMNIFNSVDECDDSIYDNEIESFANFPTLLNELESILPYLDLKNDKIRKLIVANENASKVLLSYCLKNHFEHLKVFAAMGIFKGKTALNIARARNNQACVQVLEAVDTAQSIEDLPDDLKFMIEENIMQKIFTFQYLS